MLAIMRQDDKLMQSRSCKVGRMQWTTVVVGDSPLIVETSPNDGDIDRRLKRKIIHVNLSLAIKRRFRRYNDMKTRGT